MYNHEQEHLRLQRKMQKLGSLMLSMEAYLPLAAQGLSRQAAVVVSRDLQRVADLIGEDAMGLEAHSGLANVLSHAMGMEDASAIADKIVAAIKRFKEWLMSAYKLVKDQIGALMISFTRLNERVSDYKERVKTVPEQGVEVHIPTKLANQVAIQGAMNEGHFPELRSLANFGAVVYPEALGDFYNELSAVVKHFDPTDDPTTLVAAIEATLKPLNFTNMDNKTYPGNVMIIQDDSGYNYSIAQVEARVVEEDIVRRSRTSGELQHELAELEKVIAIAEKLQDVNGKVETAINKVIEATDELEAKVKGDDEAKKAHATSLITSVLSTTAQVKSNTASIVRYLGKVIEAHLAIIDIEVKTSTKKQQV